MKTSFGFAVLSYNHPHITSDCLQSILQHIPASQIILCHNGSEIKHMDYLKNKFPQIHHFEMKVNKGFSGGANALLLEAFEKWEWVYFFTNDTLLCEIGNLPPEPGFYAPQIWRRKLGVVDSIGGGFKPQDQKIYHFKDAKEWNDLQDKLYIPGTAFLIHKEVFNKVGGFDESLHTYWEDVDFSQRTIKANVLLKPWPAFQLIHKVGKTCHKKPFYTQELFHRNKEIVSNRYLI